MSNLYNYLRKTTDGNTIGSIGGLLLYPSSILPSLAPFHNFGEGIVSGLDIIGLEAPIYFGQFRPGQAELNAKAVNALEWDVELTIRALGESQSINSLIPNLPRRMFALVQLHERDHYYVVGDDTAPLRIVEQEYSTGRNFYDTPSRPITFHTRLRHFPPKTELPQSVF